MKSVVLAAISLIFLGSSAFSQDAQIRLAGVDLELAADYVSRVKAHREVCGPLKFNDQHTNGTKIVYASLNAIEKEQFASIATAKYKAQALILSIIHDDGMAEVCKKSQARINRIFASVLEANPALLGRLQ